MPTSMFPLRSRVQCPDTCKVFLWEGGRRVIKKGYGNLFPSWGTLQQTCHMTNLDSIRFQV